MNNTLYICLMFATMFVGGFSLSRINPEYGNIGMAGEVRYWLFYGLFYVVVLNIIRSIFQKRKKLIPLSVLWWILLVSVLHGYLILSVLWTPNPMDAIGKIPDILLLVALLPIALFIFCQSLEQNIQFFLKLIFYLSLACIIGGISKYWSDVEGMKAFWGGAIGFSRIMCFGVFAATYFWIKTKRMYWLIFVPVFVYGALSSGSRAAVLSLVLAYSFFLIFIIRKQQISLVRTFVIVIISLLLFLLPPMREKLNMFLETCWISGSKDWRFENLYFADREFLFPMAWGIFLEHPICGAGLGGFEQITGYNYPHNLILNIAAEGGIIGLGLFGMVFLLLVVRWFHPRNMEHNISFYLGIFYFIASMFAGTYYDAKLMWLFFLLYMIPPEVNKMREVSVGKSRLERTI